ncbi:vacuole import and degradation [Trypanosoma theileri]|uniref:Vacuole import and degradation n=1 Tax=Trypanosoma theileri TaxID=67003 RepID=A0A1X0NPH3_9TRYP|nr:vacuole import and degradation [Trypanosoma theileri]ORC86612.1 vacuole import and degradation [Trypanosoma theileri]
MWSKNKDKGHEEEKVLFSEYGTLYFMKGERYKAIFDSSECEQCTMRILRISRESFFIQVLADFDGEESEVLIQPIGCGLSFGYSRKAGSVHWPAYMDGKLESMAFVFSGENSRMTPEDITMRFVEIYNRCTYALLTSSDVDAITNEDEGYEYIGNSATSQIPDEDYQEPVYELDVSHEAATKTGGRNICYSESMKFNNAMVVRRAKDSVELQTHKFDSYGFNEGTSGKVRIPGLTTCEDALLDDTETKLQLLSIDDQKLYEYDIDYGKVVQEHKLPEKVTAITYSAHVADPVPVYTCLTDNVAFNVDCRMDPRKNIVMEPGCTLDKYRLTSLKKPFTCHATTRDGHLVIGDMMGSIRLYRGPPGSRRKDGKYNPKAAQTLLETKVPIVAVDVTADGAYVVAVCEKFLLFMPTAYVDDRGENTTGFVSKMGKKKPTPLKLQPTSKQLAVLGGIEKLDFVSGGFDRYENGGREVCITAYSGNYIFTWSLEAVKRAEENGRACLGESALVRNDVIGVSAHIPDKLMYLTDSDICMAPLKLHERTERGSRRYAYL